MKSTAFNPISTQTKREIVPKSQVIGGVIGGFDENEFETRFETRPENSPTYREVKVSGFPSKGTMGGFHSPSHPTQEAPITSQHKDNSIDLDSNPYLKTGGSFISSLDFAGGAAQEITKVGEIASDTAKSFGEAGLSLLKDIVGIGEETSKRTAQNTQENTTSASNATTIQADHETTLLRQKEVQEYLEEMKAKQSIESQEQKAKDAIGILGRQTTEDDLSKAGTTKEHLYTKYALHRIAEADAEIAEKVKDQQQDASMAATNPKQFVGENDLQNREGGSQLGGVGDVSPG